MTYIENIFICMASPLLVAALCMGRRQLRLFLFCFAGMLMCLLSAYINTFLAAVCQADALAATVEIAPVVEEGMKLLPLVFYLLVFEPEPGPAACWARRSRSTRSIIFSSPTAARRSISPMPCRCCWWRRESCACSCRGKQQGRLSARRGRRLYRPGKCCEFA